MLKTRDHVTAISTPLTHPPLIGHAWSWSSNESAASPHSNHSCLLTDILPIKDRCRECTVRRRTSSAVGRLKCLPLLVYTATIQPKPAHFPLPRPSALLHVGPVPQLGMSSFRVIIVGGGIGGLTLANCLQHAGIDYLLLEGREQIGMHIGAAVGFEAPGCRILDQLGVLSSLEDIIEPYKSFDLRDVHGKLKWSSDFLNVVQAR